MYFIETNQESEKKHKNYKFLDFLQKLMFENGYKYGYKPIGVGVYNENVEYLTNVLLQKSKISLCLIWSCVFNQNDLIIKVMLYEDSNSKYSTVIKKLIERSYYEVLQYLNITNDTVFQQGFGNFYIMNPNPKIVFRIFQGQMLSKISDQKYQNFFIKKLAYINLMFGHQIQLILEKFKILPKPKDTQQQALIKNRLLVLKQVFQVNRINREKSSNVDLRFKKLKLAGEHVKILLMGNQMSNQKIIGISQAQVKDVQYCYSKTLQKIHANLNQSFSNQPYIMLPIQINETVYQTQISKGGFGKVFKGKYICKYDKTIYQNINKELSKFVSFDKEVELLLCKKQCLKNGQFAFQNEKQVLFNLRNKKCPYIAQYYSHSGNNFLKDNKIYLEAYNISLQKINLNFQQKLQISNQLLKGLLFLIQNQMIHRDIKPQNLMIDKNLNLRIIDFGGCCYSYKSQQTPFNNKSTQLNKLVYVTKGFFSQYRAYEQLFKTPDSKHKMLQDQFYRHQLFDIFSYGKVLDILFNIKYYQQFQESYLLNELKFLSMKCTEINPADRLSHEQIAVYIDCLIRLQELQEIKI